HTSSLRDWSSDVCSSDLKWGLPARWRQARSPSTSASAPAAIEQADPTSPWQPTSAPEIDAFSLSSTPIAAAVSKNRATPSPDAPDRKSGAQGNNATRGVA